ncbi:MAG: deaminase [Candidatus Woesearchaeota archaeon]|jgi:dCMP deaminase|nr:deaminase [Candidatus Woesearchaeota archaeon]MDP7199211.1 deaminase [Candidatus Woesearchaeota archaeon]MDP7467824.1 deaminase [Candidatus Woesearchaeota archaeon]MDP7647814.1 deaminase [Candidatus Woesearchaeota archaeon]
MIIGLVGTIGAGKQTILDYLQEKYGYNSVSCSDVLRDMLKEQGKELTRDNLRELGNVTRKEGGNGAIAKILLEKLRNNWKANYVVDSIRHPDEVAVLRTSPLFHLVAVDADLRLRFDRVKARKREQDPVTLPAFVERDQREMFGTGNEQRIRETMELADELVLNNGSVEELKQRVDDLNLVSDERLRPSWDDYFMRLARLAAQRSNCMSRKVGSVLTNNNRVIATGYNGTPKGVKNCNEGGCERCNSAVAKGTSLSECLCLHGEENAIIEAGRTRAEGSTIYTSFLPCLWCTKMIIQAGIKEVVFSEIYDLHEASIKLFETAGVLIRRLK